MDLQNIDTTNFPVQNVSASELLLEAQTKNEISFEHTDHSVFSSSLASSEPLSPNLLTSDPCPDNVLETNETEEEICEDASDVTGKTKLKHPFQVNVDAIESVCIENQADEIKHLGLKVFDQQTLEKGILEQVEQESQRLQTEEELAVLDTTIKQKESLLKKSAGKLKAKSKVALESEKSQVNELTALQEKQSLLRERLTKGLKDKVNEDESERERSIRLGEMTPFGTVLGPKTSELPSSLSQYLKKQQELQMKMQEKNEMKKKSSDKKSILSVNLKRQRKKSENSIVIPRGEPSSTPSEESSLKKTTPKKKRERLGSYLAIVDGEEYLSPAPSPGETQTINFEESGSEYKPSEDDDEGDTAQDSEGKSSVTEMKKNTKPKQQTSQSTNRSKKRKKNSNGDVCSKPKKKKMRNSQDPEDWASDDSDWICTDDELSSDSENPAKRLKKLVKKEKDDGNEDDYYRRIKQWEKSFPCLREEMQEDCHELDNDFKISSLIWNKLYKYQQVGVQWFWELHQQGCGGILGDEMGLGKTVQVIAFLAGLRLSRVKSGLMGYRSLGPVLIVCPTTVMHQWVREFHTWFPPLRVAILHESGTFQGKRDHLIKNMIKAKGVVITSYTAVVRMKDALLDANWHYVILDEGHKIRNPDAQVTMVVKQFRTPHRLILSGSPVQNHLRELWSLMDFVFPGKLGTLPVFMAQFGVPITQGGYANASEVMVATAFKCATVLKDTITPYLLRRMKSDVNNHISLPPKNEQVLFCRLTDQQRELYKGYIDSGEVGRILDGRIQIFVGLINLRKICNHPHLYSGGPKLFVGESEDRIPVEDRYGHWSKAGKMIVLEALLKMWHRQEHRVLIFSQSKQMLGIIESFVIQQGYKYLKLDGGTSISARQPLINKFNQDKSYFVMILTTKVGGLGVNLTGADRVVIYDPDWNPATDTQARERAWRIGQQNCVTVYRLITAGTIEEKMYHRQIFKQFLCNKVLKDPRQRRFFKSNDLMELFTLKEVDTEGSTETSAIFAGTGSQVHVKKKSAQRKDEVRSVKRNEANNVSPNENDETSKTKSPSRKGTKSNGPKTVGKSTPPKNSPKSPVTVQFSETKLQHMKQLAAMLSKKLAQKTDSVASTSENFSSFLTDEVEATSSNTQETPAKEKAELPVLSSSVDEHTNPNTSAGTENIDCQSEEKGCDQIEPNSVSSDALPVVLEEGCTNKEKENSCVEQATDTETGSKSDDVSKLTPTLETTVTHLPQVKDSKEPREKHAKESKKHKKHKKHKKDKNAKFEGERVPHLVRSSALKSEENVDEIAHNSKQDDYVLRKLFSKTGLQTAMRHDKIMEGGHADYALIEGEARKVAQEAVKALKESRRQCWSATSGVPTWTGAGGALRRTDTQPSNSKLKFGPKKKFGAKKSSTVTSGDSKEESGSGGLLAKIRARNMLLTENEDNQPADKSIVSNSNSDLLDDIRAFVAFGAQTDGQASTDEIVSHFKDRLPSESSALFKQMLNQVCEFHRSPGGKGMWKLLPDFVW